MDETLKRIEKVIRGILEAMEIAPKSLDVCWQEIQERIYVSLDAGDRNGFLIGKEGRMLEALKVVVEAVVSHTKNEKVEIYLDVGGYWAKMENAALEKAKCAASEVRETGRPVSLEPMHAMLRRSVHRALAQEGDIETRSEGEDLWRKIIISPKRATDDRR